MAYLIPLKKEGKKGWDLILVFDGEIWILHGIPTDMVSDRDSRLI
jgi:hypothetical protein